MSNSNKYNYIDFTTFFIAFILMAVSVLVVYTASSAYGLVKAKDSEYFLILHVQKLILAVIIMILGIAIDYHKYQKFTKVALIFGVILLLYTLKFGEEIKNTHRFINIFGIRIQPSEFVKFILIAHLAKLLADKSVNVTKFKEGYLPLLIWLIIVSGLIVVQPSYSMASIIVLTGILFIYLGGARLKHIFLSVLLVVPPLLFFLFKGSLFDGNYRINRFNLYWENLERLIFLRVDEILGYLKSIENVKNSFGQVWQSIIAFGNGGILGVGLGNSRQKDFYIPEAYNDFIFSIIGEEYGLIGTMAIIAMFMILFLKGLKIAQYARDDFGRYLALGITLMITNFALVNAAVALAIIPVTGLPMPFVSYGGSSTFATAFAVGVLLNISKQTDLNPRIAHVPVIGTVNAEGKI